MDKHVRTITRDARSLPADALEDLRRRVVAAVESGVTQLEAARVFGVSRQTVGAWVRAYRSNGDGAFRPGRRGRRPGEQLALSVSQQLTIISTIATHPPDKVGLRYRLWTRQAVAELINRECQVMLGTTTVGNYLLRWGFTTEHNLLDSLRGHNALAALDSRRAGDAGDADDVEAMPLAWIDGAEVLWATWLRPRLAVAAEAEIGALGLAANTRLADLAGLDVLLGVSNRGAMFFQLGSDPCDARQVRDFLIRLTDQLRRRINIIIGWRPSLHVDELVSWADENSHTTAVRFVPC